MTTPNKELDEIRAMTNPIPAEEAPEAPPMVCPACGTELTDEGCPNPECEG